MHGSVAFKSTVVWFEVEGLEVDCGIASAEMEAATLTRTHGK